MLEKPQNTQARPVVARKKFQGEGHRCSVFLLSFVTFKSLHWICCYRFKQNNNHCYPSDLDRIQVEMPKIWLNAAIESEKIADTQNHFRRGHLWANGQAEIGRRTSEERERQSEWPTTANVLWSNHLVFTTMLTATSGPTATNEPHQRPETPAMCFWPSDSDLTQRAHINQHNPPQTKPKVSSQPPQVQPPFMKKACRPQLTQCQAPKNPVGRVLEWKNIWVIRLPDVRKLSENLIFHCGCPL